MSYAQKTRFSRSGAQAAMSAISLKATVVQEGSSGNSHISVLMRATGPLCLRLAVCMDHVVVKSPRDCQELSYWM